MRRVTWGISTVKRHIIKFTCNLSHMWYFTREISHVECGIWNCRNKSYNTFQMWNFTCEISHVIFYMWKDTCEISHVESHKWNFTHETHDLSTCVSRLKKHVVLELHMWIICAISVRVVLQWHKTNWIESIDSRERVGFLITSLGVRTQEACEA